MGYNALDYSENRDVTQLVAVTPPSIFTNKRVVRSTNRSRLILGVKLCPLPEYPPTADYVPLSVRLLTVGPDAKLSDKATRESNIRNSVLSPLTPIALSGAGREKSIG